MGTIKHVEVQETLKSRRGAVFSERVQPPHANCQKLTGKGKREMTNVYNSRLKAPEAQLEATGDPQ